MTDSLAVADCLCGQSAAVSIWNKVYTCYSIPFSFGVLQVAELDFLKPGQGFTPVNEIGIRKITEIHKIPDHNSNTKVY